jgi:hypothetical protein
MPIGVLDTAIEHRQTIRKRLPTIRRHPKWWMTWSALLKLPARDYPRSLGGASTVAAR